MLLKVCSSTVAVAACVFNWLIVNLSRKQVRIVWLTATAFKCDQLKRKGGVESSLQKYTKDCKVYGTWKEYGNYNVSLLMSK